MAAETQYTANTGMETISTANSNLDGTGTLSSAIVTGASNGTLIKTVTIKAQANTTQGMVRLFIYDGSNTKLLTEIEIPAVIKAATDPAFETTLTINYSLKSGWVLKASTEKAETFNVIAEAQDWTYAAPVRAETTKYAAYNGAAAISTANSNLDGTGTLGTALISSGCNMWSVTIKAQGSTTAGMVRLFIYDGTNTKLLKEIPVRATTQSGTAQTFYSKVNFDNGFALKSGWQLKASTEKGEAFSVISESVDWSYPSIAYINAENDDRLITENGYYLITE